MSKNKNMLGNLPQIVPGLNFVFCILCGFVFSILCAQAEITEAQKVSQKFCRRIHMFVWVQHGCKSSYCSLRALNTSLVLTLASLLCQLW